MKVLLVLLVLVGVAHSLDRLQNVQPARVSSPKLKVEQRGGRIVGGQRATPGQFPHQVAMFCDFFKSKQFCGAVVINNDTVITAAHCIDGAITCDLIFGAQNIRTREATQVEIQIQTLFNAIVHPKFNISDVGEGYDIAIINLPQAIQFTDYIQPIALPSRSDVNQSWTGFTAISSGWGRESDTAGAISEELNWMESTVMSNRACNELWQGLIIPSMVCLTGDGPKSVCRGDSGGPSYVVDKGVKKLIGLADFVAGGLCETGYPHVHTRPEFYLDWLEENSSFRADP